MHTIATRPAGCQHSPPPASVGSTPRSEAASPGPRETVSHSSFGEKVKRGAVIAGISLAGAALGAYAGLATGVLAGLAGVVAGASGGAVAGAYLPGGKVRLGALAGAIGGGILAASAGGPIAAVLLGAAGATAPVGLLMAALSGAE